MLKLQGAVLDGIVLYSLPGRSKRVDMGKGYKTNKQYQKIPKRKLKTIGTEVLMTNVYLKAISW